MPNIRRSLILSFAQNYTSLLITLPTIMILARFLTPAQTGVFSVAMAVTSLVHVLRDFGVGSYLIQEQELNREKIRAAFTITLLMAWIVALALFLGAPFAGDFYGEGGVRDVLRVLALNFVVIPIGSPALSLLRRELAYGALYVIQTSSAVVRSATSITMAILGFSYMSLAWGSLAGIVASTIVVSFYRSSDTWLWPGLSEWRRVLAFGSKQTMIEIMKQVSGNANDLIIGRMLGFAATGLFSRGQGLIALFQRKVMSSIKSVAFPAFASYHRSGKGINEFYIKGVRYMTAIAWPFYAFVAIMAHPIIFAAFGQQWLPAAPILRILAVASALSTLNFSLGQAYIASGNINTSLKLSTIVQPIRLALLVLAAFYSIEAVASVRIVIVLMSLTLNYRAASRLFKLHFRDVIKATYSSAAITAVSMVIPGAIYALYEAGELTNPWVTLIAGGAGGAIGWLAGVMITNHPLVQEMQSMLSRLNVRRYIARYRHSN